MIVYSLAGRFRPVWRLLSIMAFAIITVPVAAQAQEAVVDVSEDADVDEGIARAVAKLAVQNADDNAKAVKPLLDAALDGKFDQAEAMAGPYLTSRPWWKGKLEPRYRVRVVENALKDALIAQALAGDLAKAESIAATFKDYSKRASPEADLSSKSPLDLIELILKIDVIDVINDTPIDYDRAEKLADAFLAAFEKNRSPETEDTAELLGMRGEFHARKGQFGAAKPLFDRALDIHIRLKSDADEDAAYLMNEVARNEENLGRYKESELLYRQVYVLRQKLDGANAPLTWTSLNNVAINLDHQKRYPEAELLHRQAIAGRTALLGRVHAGVRTSWHNLAQNLESQGRYDEAMVALDEAVRANPLQNDSDRRGEIKDLMLRATLFAAKGKTGEAITMSRDVVGRFAALSGPESRDTMLATSQLAVFLENADRHEEAEPLARKVLEYHLATKGENHPETATAQANYASILGSLGKKGDEEAILRQSLASLTKLYGKDDARLSNSYSNLAVMLFGQAAALNTHDDRKAKLDEAATMARQALLLDLKALGTAHPDVALRQENLGAILAASGQNDEARRLQRQGLATVSAAFGETHPRVGGAQQELARLLKDDPATLDEAYDLARKAVANKRAASAQNAADAAGGAVPYASDSAFAILIETAWKQSEAHPDQNRTTFAEAFAAAQDMTLTASTAAMAQSAVRAAAGQGPLADLIRAQQVAETGLAKAQAKLFAAYAADRKTAPDLLKSIFVQQQTQLAALNARIDKEFPAYRALTAPAALPLDQVQAALAPDEAVLLVLPVNDDIYSFAVSAKAIAWYRGEENRAETLSNIRIMRCFVDAATCNKSGQKYVDALQDSPKALEGYQPFDLERAFQLYLDMVSHVEMPLADAKRVYYVTSGAMADLPLGLITMDQPDPDADFADPDTLAKADWFADRYAVTRLPAVSALRLPVRGEPAGARSSFVGYGSPVLGGDGLFPDRSGPLFRTTGSGILADPAMLRALSPLPGTKVELNAMATEFAANGAAVHLDQAATETAVKADAALHNATVIAFATHGLLPGDVTKSGEPGLVLTPPLSASRLDDGILTASETTALALSADWVILSACNTASPEGDKGGDSLSGLARGFLYAGAKALLASHWRVSDDATAALTVETLAERKRHPSFTRAQALQAAMHTVRTGKRADQSVLAGWIADWAHPANWAPFSHIANHDD